MTSIKFFSSFHLFPDNICCRPFIQPFISHAPAPFPPNSIKACLPQQRDIIALKKITKDCISADFTIN